MAESTHHKIIEDLHRLIASGAYEPGGRFLTEREIAEDHHVSRITANKALASLVGEGLLEFRRGVGTFVREQVPHAVLKGFSQGAVEQGVPIETRVIALRPASRTEAVEVSSKLAVATSESLWYAERLRSVAGDPVRLERIVLKASKFPGLTKDQLTGSLMALSAQCGLRVLREDLTVRAMTLNAVEAAHLGGRAGDAALVTEGIAIAECAGPVWFARCLARADALSLQSGVGLGQESAGLHWAFPTPRAVRPRS